MSKIQNYITENNLKKLEKFKNIFAGKKGDAKNARMGSMDKTPDSII